MPMGIGRKSRRLFTGIIDSDRRRSAPCRSLFFFPVKTDGQPSEITYWGSKIHRLLTESVEEKSIYFLDLLVISFKSRFVMKTSG